MVVLSVFSPRLVSIASDAAALRAALMLLCSAVACRSCSSSELRSGAYNSFLVDNTLSILRFASSGCDSTACDSIFV
jgi:hypothetical protein